MEKLEKGKELAVGNHKVEIIDYIAEGGFAHIYSVKVTPPVNNTGINEIDNIACLKRVLVPDKVGLNQLRSEVEVMQKLSHSHNIVRYFDSNASRQPHGNGYEVLVLMELCSNKSLLDYMNKRIKTKLSKEEILRIMFDVSKAVAAMHKIHLIHRDIKIENVLIDSQNNFKLCDFGSTSTFLRPPKTQQEFQYLHNDILHQTTPQYRCPEMIDLYRALPIDNKSDIWALGVFLYKLCYYTTPFEASGELAILHAAYQFPTKPDISQDVKNLIIIMLQENPAFRPNIVQVLFEVAKIMGDSNPNIEDFYGEGEYKFPEIEYVVPVSNDAKTPEVQKETLESEKSGDQDKKFYHPQYHPSHYNSREGTPNPDAIPLTGDATSTSGEELGEQVDNSNLSDVDDALENVEDVEERYPALEALGEAKAPSLGVPQPKPEVRRLTPEAVQQIQFQNYQQTLYQQQQYQYQQLQYQQQLQYEQQRLQYEQYEKQKKQQQMQAASQKPALPGVAQTQSFGPGTQENDPNYNFVNNLIQSNQAQNKQPTQSAKSSTKSPEYPQPHIYQPSVVHPAQMPHVPSQTRINENMYPTISTNYQPSQQIQHPQLPQHQPSFPQMQQSPPPQKPISESSKLDLAVLASKQTPVVPSSAIPQQITRKDKNPFPSSQSGTPLQKINTQDKVSAPPSSSVTAKNPWADASPPPIVFSNDSNDLSRRESPPAPSLPKRPSEKEKEETTETTNDVASSIMTSDPQDSSSMLEFDDAELHQRFENLKLQQEEKRAAEATAAAKAAQTLAPENLIDLDEPSHSRQPSLDLKEEVIDFDDDYEDIDDDDGEDATPSKTKRRSRRSLFSKKDHLHPPPGEKKKRSLSLKRKESGKNDEGEKDVSKKE